MVEINRRGNVIGSVGNAASRTGQMPRPQARPVGLPGAGPPLARMPAPPRAVGSMALADAATTVFGEFALGQFQQAREEATREGSRAGQREAATAREAGRAPALTDESTAFGRAFDQAAGTAYLAQVSGDIRATTSRLALTHQYDPEGFDHAFTGYMTGTLQDMPEPLRLDVQTEMEQRRGQALSRIQEQAIERERQRQDAIMFREREALMIDAANAWRSGDLNAAERAATNFSQLVDSQLETGRISGREAAQTLTVLSQTAAEQMILGSFDGAVNAGRGERFIDQVRQGGTPRSGQGLDITLDALIQAESGGNPEATSADGRVGLIQMRPEDAEAAAEALGVGFDLARLSSDGDYARHLGRQHLESLMDRYGDSPVLAVAAHSAGPEAVDRWIQQYGDPRSGEISEVDFAARLPAEHTRRTVGQVMHQIAPMNVGEALGQLPPDRRDALVRMMRTEMNRRAAQHRTAVSELRQEASAVRDVFEEGFDVEEGQFDQLIGRAEQLGDGATIQTLSAARREYAFQREFRMMEPAAQEAWINGAYAEIRQNGDQATMPQIERLRLAENLHNATRSAIQQDPLSHATRVGWVDAEPIQLGGEDASASFRRREARAEEVAARYSIAPPMFTRDEEAAVSNAIAAGNADARTALIGTMRDGLSPRGMNEALRRIGVDHPVFGVAAGRTTEGAAGAEVAREILRGQDVLDAQPDIIPTGMDLSDGVSRTLGVAFAEAPRTEAAVIEAAKALYALDMQRQGRRDRMLDNNAWRDALRLAGGGIRDAGGNVRGGPMDWNGHDMVPPVPGMESREFSSMIHRIADEDLSAWSDGGEPPRYADGRTMTRDEFLNDGQLVNVGEGRYMVRIGDIGYLAGAGPNGYYVLDLRENADELLSRPPPATRTERTGEALRRLGGAVEDLPGALFEQLDDPNDPPLPEPEPELPRSGIYRIPSGSDMPDSLRGPQWGTD